jgi:hypothetical protein
MRLTATLCLVLGAVWLALLTLVLAATLREVAIIRINLARVIALSERKLLALGTPISPDTRRAIPEVQQDSSYLLWLKRGEDQSERLLREINHTWSSFGMADPVVVLFGDDPDHHESGHGSVPALAGARVIHDPQATAAAKDLNLPPPPFLLKVGDGVVRGWSRVRSIDDWDRLRTGRTGGAEVREALEGSLDRQGYPEARPSADP